MTPDFKELISLIAVGIPLLGVFTIPIVAILAGHRRQTLELETRHRERMSAIEKGVPVPPDPPPAPRKPGSWLLRGLIWLGVGLALVLGRFDYDLSRLGWVPVAVGAAYLIYYVVEGRRQPATESA
jgi:hypothetical protein